MGGIAGAPMVPGGAFRACDICIRGEEAAVEVVDGGALVLTDASDPTSDTSLSLSDGPVKDGKYRIIPEKKVITDIIVG